MFTILTFIYKEVTRKYNGPLGNSKIMPFLWTTLRFISPDTVKQFKADVV